MTINNVENELTALVIIDMQRGMLKSAMGARNNLCAEQNILRILKAFREKKLPVVIVRHISRNPGSPFWPGQEGVEFQTEFEPREREHVVEKHVPDAFIHSNLEKWLHVRSISQLVIVGVSTNNSVESTARTSGNLGFNTIVVEDATFTFSKKDHSGVLRSAEEVHSMSLSNLHQEYATILSTGVVLNAIQNNAQ